MHLLEKAMTESLKPQQAYRALEDYALSLAKQGEMMNYLKNHHPEVSHKIEEIVKVHERQLERDRGEISL